jgi:hypothetical protein
MNGMTASAWSVLQLITALLCAGMAFGVLLTTMFVRGKLPFDHPQSALFDLAYTDRTYQLASIIASIGAMAAISQGWGLFGSFVAVAVAFQVAEHLLLPRMRAALDQGVEIPLRGTRARFELLQTALLAVIFFKMGMPPLITLASIYGL